MKIKHLLTLTLICLFALSTNAQKRFILENKGSVVNTRIFDSLDSAVAALQNDDILYIPGGNFGLPSNGMVIDKNSVSIIGAGHNPDSTIATGRTYLTGGIIVNGDNISISGIYLLGNINVDGITSNPIITGFLLKNSNVGSVTLNNDVSNQPETELSSISNNIIRGSIVGGYTSSAFISHNIIAHQIIYFNGSNVSFSYNIFLKTSGYLFATINGATFYKDILILGTSLSASSNNTFNYCSISITNPSIYFTVGTNVFNNTTSLPTFVGGSLPSSFNYTFDFHHSGGDLGIYGGNGYSPIPRNPHIKSAEISEQTDNNGNLQIIFEVEAKQ